jgi:uncharacterized protein (TIGR03437 family)
MAATIMETIRRHPGFEEGDGIFNKFFRRLYVARVTGSPYLALITAAWATAMFGLSAQAALPVVTVSNNGIVNFTYVTGAANPDPQTVVVSSDQPVIVSATNTVYPAGQAGNWLTVFPPNGSLSLATPATLTLFVTPLALPAGSYSAQVSFATAGPTDSTSVTSFAVFLVVTGGSGTGGGTNFGETMTVTPTALAYAFQPGSNLPPTQTLTVTTSDSANVTTTVTTNDGNPWLLISPVTSATPGTINITINPATLPGGTYTGTITVTAPNTVTQVPVTLTVGNVGLSSLPASLTINEPQNYGVSAYQPITINAAAAIPISISTLTDVGNWLQVDLNNSKTPATIGVRANDSGLAQGAYTGVVTVQSGPSSVITVPVTLNIGIPAPVQLQPSSVAFTWQINDPLPAAQAAKINSLTGSPVAFTVAPTTNDGANWLNAVATPATTPGGVSIGVNPAALAAGSYSGFVNITPTVTGASPQPIVVSLTVKPAPVPTIKGVTSAASYASGAVAPGELVTIFGSSIGPVALTVSPAGTAPQTLANTSVTFDGIPAPIYYVSSTQTSVQVPYNIASGQTVLQLTYNGVPSATTTITRLPAVPGLFTSDSSGQRQLAALNADLSVNSAANPAARGAALVLYGTGEGQTNPASVEGSRVPIIVPLPQTPLPVTVTIGGQFAPVQYAGETPGLLSGLLQINVTVPATTPVGASIPVLVTIGGQTTQSNATVAIK